MTGLADAPRLFAISAVVGASMFSGTALASPCLGVSATTAACQPDFEYVRLAQGDVFSFKVLEARPGTDVFILMSVHPPDKHPQRCFPGTGVCTDLVNSVRMARLTSGPLGAASTWVDSPEKWLPPNMTLWAQAIWVDPVTGEGGVSEAIHLK